MRLCSHSDSHEYSDRTTNTRSSNTSHATILRFRCNNHRTMVLKEQREQPPVETLKQQRTVAGQSDTEHQANHEGQRGSHSENTKKRGKLQSPCGERRLEVEEKTRSQ
ncbi:hypothetical protein PS2_005139 [Malus domestica]